MRWLVMGGILWAQGAFHPYHEIEKAFEVAKAQKKPMWVMVSASWCGPCKWVEKNVFPNPQFQQYYQEKFVCVKLMDDKPRPTEAGRAFIRQHRIRAFPTFLYLDSEGKVLHRFEGVPVKRALNVEEAVEGFLQHGQKALSRKAVN
ncbi:MAG: thioredoxin family protein [Bacteroidia bacterium]